MEPRSNDPPRVLMSTGASVMRCTVTFPPWLCSCRPTYRSGTRAVMNVLSDEQWSVCTSAGLSGVDVFEKHDKQTRHVA